MERIETQAGVQLSVIELGNEIKISNKYEITSLIAECVKENRQVLLICTLVNLWIASNKIRGEFELPIEILSEFVDAAMK
jgi:hypothetical protein